MCFLVVRASQIAGESVVSSSSSELVEVSNDFLSEGAELEEDLTTVRRAFEAFKVYENVRKSKIQAVLSCTYLFRRELIRRATFHLCGQRGGCRRHA